MENKIRSTLPLPRFEGEGRDLAVIVTLNGPLPEVNLDDCHETILAAAPFLDDPKTREALIALVMLFADAEDLPYPKVCTFTVPQLEEYAAEFQ